MAEVKIESTIDKGTAIIDTGNKTPEAAIAEIRTALKIVGAKLEESKDGKLRATASTNSIGIIAQELGDKVSLLGSTSSTVPPGYSPHSPKYLEQGNPQPAGKPTPVPGK